MECKHYVYVYFRPNGMPCYIGIGRQARRWMIHMKVRTNNHLWNIIQKNGGTLPVVKIREGLSKQEAREVEIALIKAIGREDLGEGPLVNLTDGGEGLRRTSPNKGRTFDAITRQKMSAAQKIRHANDPEWRVILAKKHRGNSYALGKPLREDTKARMAVSQKLRRELERQAS